MYRCKFARLLKGQNLDFLQEKMADITIHLPSKAEQEKIVDFITAIDEKINRTENQLQKTVKYKKGLLQQMFI